MKRGEYFKMNEELYHFGIPRRSGRYPWGSGDRPFQSSGGKSSKTERKKQRVAKGYAKSTRKLEKIDAKRQRQQEKANKSYTKAEKKYYSKLSSQKSTDKAYSRAESQQYKANRLAKKGEDWYKKMKKKYSNQGINIDPKTKALGEKYIELVAANTKMYYASRGR